MTEYGISIIECENGVEIDGKRTEAELKAEGYKPVCEVEPEGLSECVYIEYPTCFVQVWNEVDELGKVMQTEGGNGTWQNPKKWKEGDAVVVGLWYKTPSDYIWEAIKNGTPESETDKVYFDVVGL